MVFKNFFVWTTKNFRFELFLIEKFINFLFFESIFMKILWWFIKFYSLNQFWKENFEKNIFIFDFYSIFGMKIYHRRKFFYKFAINFEFFVKNSQWNQKFFLNNLLSSIFYQKPRSKKFFYKNFIIFWINNYFFRNFLIVKLKNKTRKYWIKSKKYLWRENFANFFIAFEIFFGKHKFFIKILISTLIFLNKNHTFWSIFSKLMLLNSHFCSKNTRSKKNFIKNIFLSENFDFFDRNFLFFDNSFDFNLWCGQYFRVFWFFSEKFLFFWIFFQFYRSFWCKF